MKLIAIILIVSCVSLEARSLFNIWNDVYVTYESKEQKFNLGMDELLLQSEEQNPVYEKEIQKINFIYINCDDLILAEIKHPKRPVGVVISDIVIKSKVMLQIEGNNLIFYYLNTSKPEAKEFDLFYSKNNFNSKKITNETVSKELLKEKLNVAPTKIKVFNSNLVIIRATRNSHVVIRKIISNMGSKEQKNPTLLPTVK